MKSDGVSYETIFHTVQYRGFAAMYDCYLTFMTRVVFLCIIAYMLLHVTWPPAVASKLGLVFLLSMSERISTAEKAAPVNLCSAHRQCFSTLSAIFGSYP